MSTSRLLTLALAAMLVALPADRLDARELETWQSWRSTVEIALAGRDPGWPATIVAIGRPRTVAPYLQQVPAATGHRVEGLASFYWQDQMTASGERFDRHDLTAAHPTLPFGTRVSVTNAANGRSVIVRINDRGPYTKGRIIDLSDAAAGAIGMRAAGVVPVRLSIVP